MFKKYGVPVMVAAALALVGVSSPAVSAIGNWPGSVTTVAIGNWPGAQTAVAIGNWPGSVTAN